MLQGESDSSVSNMTGLLLAECEALSGDLEGAKASLDLYASTLDTAEERVYSLHVSAIVAVISEEKPQEAIAAIERASQAHMDALQVRHLVSTPAKHASQLQPGQRRLWRISATAAPPVLCQLEHTRACKYTARCNL